MKKLVKVQGEKKEFFFSVIRGGDIKSHKDRGTIPFSLNAEVRDVFSGSHVLGGLIGNAYSKKETWGPRRIEDDDLKITIATDTIVLGKGDLVKELPDIKKMQGRTDREIIGYTFKDCLQSKGINNDAFYDFALRLKGNVSGTLAMQLLDKRTGKTSTIAYRVNGLKPACYAESPDGSIHIASETNQLTRFGFPFIYEIKPGEMLTIDDDGFEKIQLTNPERYLCVFEGAYFQKPTSIFMLNGNPIRFSDGRFSHGDITVKEFRKRLGAKLVETYPELRSLDAVTPIPFSGNGVTLGVADAAGIPIIVSLEKNPDAPRTFQMTDPLERAVETHVKFDVNIGSLQDMNIGAGDDSIVYGGITKGGLPAYLETKTNALGLIKGAAGAKKVTLFISYPPIHFPCISSFDRYKELSAYGLWTKSIKGINKDLERRVEELDDARYQTLRGLREVVDSCSFSNDCNVCMACANGDYPPDINRSHIPDDLKRHIDEARTYLDT